MPRRKKLYLDPGKALVNGGRVDVTDGNPVVTVPALEVTAEALCERIKARVQDFDELAQLDDFDRFVLDLADECAWVQTMRLDYLTKGASSKPNEWTTQILARGIATVMRKHGLRVAISEYENNKHNELQRSLYLRLVRNVCGIWFPVPKDVKGLALRAMRIKQESVATPQIKGRLKARQRAAPAVRINLTEHGDRLNALIQAYAELGPELQAKPIGKKIIERLRVIVIRKLGLNDNDLPEETIRRDIRQVCPILKLVQKKIIPPPPWRAPDREKLSEKLARK